MSSPDARGNHESVLLLLNQKGESMKTLRIAVGSFLLGAAPIAPIAAYAVCDNQIWVQDMAGVTTPMYQLMENGESCNNGVVYCAYCKRAVSTLNRSMRRRPIGWIDVYLHMLPPRFAQITGGGSPASKD